jgi:hypothetical protein
MIVITLGLCETSCLGRDGETLRPVLNCIRDFVNPAWTVAGHVLCHAIYVSMKQTLRLISFYFECRLSEINVNWSSKSIFEF